jgi:hypothetical protein
MLPLGRNITEAAELARLWALFRRLPEADRELVVRFLAACAGTEQRRAGNREQGTGAR